MDRQVCVNNQHGYVALMSILVVGAVGLAIALGLLLSSVDSARVGISIQDAALAEVLADACAEEGLEQIRSSSTYTGTGSVTISGESCSYAVSSQGGEDRTIQGSSTVNGNIKRVEVLIDQISPQINVSSWQEVDSF